MEDVLKIVKKGYSVQFDFNTKENSYVVQVEDKTGPEGSVGRKASRRVPLTMVDECRGCMTFSELTPDDIFFAVIECLGYVKGAS